MRVVVLGNCQAAGLAAGLRALSPDLEIDDRSVGDIDFTDEGQVARLIADLSAYDLALIQSIGGPARPQLAETIASVRDGVGPGARRWPVLAYNGLHPDCVYVLRDGRTIDGAMGPYHSALACAAWLEGLPPSRAVALFNAFVFAGLGYFDTEAAAGAFRRRAADDGLDLDGVLTAPTPFMHTINHPVIAVLMEIARQLLDHEGLARVDDAVAPPDPLLQLPVWPIHPEIAMRHGLVSAEPVDVETLVAAEYAALERDLAAHGALDFARTSPPVQRARAFIAEHLIR